MKSEVEELVRKALELTEQDRAEVAARLLDSLEEDEDAEVDLVWTTEIERRGRELESGAIAAIPWEDLRARLTSGGGGS